MSESYNRNADIQRRLREENLRLAKRERYSDELDREIQRILNGKERIEINMSTSETKTGELVMEALIFTYLAAAVLTLLVNIVFFGANLWLPILAMTLGGAVVIGLLTYAVSIWVRAWRASRRKRG